jgi:hypothetical protein
VNQCEFCGHITTDYKNKKLCEVYPYHNEINGSFLDINEQCYYWILNLAKRDEYIRTEEMEAKQDGN